MYLNKDVKRKKMEKENWGQAWRTWITWLTHLPVSGQNWQPCNGSWRMNEQSGSCLHRPCILYSSLTITSISINQPWTFFSVCCVFFSISFCSKNILLILQAQNSNSTWKLSLVGWPYNMSFLLPVSPLHVASTSVRSQSHSISKTNWIHPFSPSSFPLFFPSSICLPFFSSPNLVPSLFPFLFTIRRKFLCHLKVPKTVSAYQISIDLLTVGLLRIVV